MSNSRAHRRRLASRLLERNTPATPPALVRPVIPGVDTTTWSDLPPAQYPPDTVAFIRRALALGDELRTLDVFVCDGCNGATITRDLHPGYHPQDVDHKHFDPRTRCQGTARAVGYPDDIPADAAASHEWYRPGEDELLTLEDKFIHHVMAGGCILRPIPADAPRT